MFDCFFYIIIECHCCLTFTFVFVFAVAAAFAFINAERYILWYQTVQYNSKNFETGK
jgi:hypothetical protein